LGENLTSCGISASLILALTLLTVYLELERIQVELIDVREKLTTVKMDVNNVEKALASSSILVSTDVLLACGNMTLNCGRVYTYAGSPALLPTTLLEDELFRCLAPCVPPSASTTWVADPTVVKRGF